LIPHIRLDGVAGIHTAGECGTLFISSDMQISVSFSLDPG